MFWACFLCFCLTCSKYCIGARSICLYTYAVLRWLSKDNRADSAECSLQKTIEPRLYALRDKKVQRIVKLVRTRLYQYTLCVNRECDFISSVTFTQDHVNLILDTGMAGVCIYYKTEAYIVSLLHPPKSRFILIYWVRHWH